VGGRDLEAAGTKFNIHIGITDDGNLPIHNREEDLLSKVSLVSFVFGLTATAVSPIIVSGRVVATTGTIPSLKDI